MVPFSGPIDPESITGETVFLVPIGPDGAASGDRVALNRVTWDPETTAAGRQDRALRPGRFAMIEAPADMPSCVTFGGPDMATLYVTSIKDSGSGRAVSRHPDGGFLFALEGLGATGIPEPHYG